MPFITSPNPETLNPGLRLAGLGLFVHNALGVSDLSFRIWAVGFGVWGHCGVGARRAGIH